MSTLGLSSLKFCGSVEIMCQRVFLIVARLRAWNPHGYWQLPTVSKAVLQKVLHDWCLYNCTFPNRWGKKKAPVSNQISLDGLRKRNLTHAPHFEKLLNITSPLKTHYMTVLKIHKYTYIKLFSHYRMRITSRGWKNYISLVQEPHVRVATPCLTSQISSFLKAYCLTSQGLSLWDTGQR